MRKPVLYKDDISNQFDWATLYTRCNYNKSNRSATKKTKIPWHNPEATGLRGRWKSPHCKGIKKTDVIQNEQLKKSTHPVSSSSCERVGGHSIITSHTRVRLFLQANVSRQSVFQSLLLWQRRHWRWSVKKTSRDAFSKGEEKNTTDCPNENYEKSSRTYREKRFPVHTPHQVSISIKLEEKK